MKRTLIERSSVAVFAAAVAAGFLYAQQKPAETQHDHGSMAAPGSKAAETNAFGEDFESEDVSSGDRQGGVF